MDRFVVEQNIDHFKRLLATELTEEKRQSILNLLAEEQAKLRSIVGKPGPGRMFRPKT